MRLGAVELTRAVVAITGGGRGIGRVTAAAFAARGATVCIGDLDRETAEAAAAEIGAGAIARQVDVTSQESFSAFIASTEHECGPIDVLVNNAGIMPTGRFLDEPLGLADAVIDVNLRGPMIGMKLVLPGMVNRGHGHIVNVASGLGRFEVPGLATYCASKHGVVGMSGTIARELEGTGVTVTAVLPSAVHTELSSGVAFPFARIAKVKPERVAAAIVESCAHRRREVMVPRWLRPCPPLVALLPAALERLVRRALGADRRALGPDPAQRRVYAERIARQATGRGR